MYAVFGVTKAIARQEAVKKVDAIDAQRNMRPQDVYYKEVAELSAKILKTMRAKQLSPTYSNLKEARQYYELAKADGAQSLVIKKKERDGFDTEKQRPILKWVTASLPATTP